MGLIKAGFSIPWAWSQSLQALSPRCPQSPLPRQSFLQDTLPSLGTLHQLCVWPLSEQSDGHMCAFELRPLFKVVSPELGQSSCSIK